MVASLTPLTRRAALGLALLPALRRPAVAADLKDIVSTPSGLRYVDFAPGSGAPPRFGQLVRFHYVGYIASEDGESLEAYDSSYERNTPYFTKHGNGLTCEGLEEALHTMRPGGRRRVLLPPSLGYSRGSASDKGPLPVKATLRDRLFLHRKADQVEAETRRVIEVAREHKGTRYYDYFQNKQQGYAI